MLASFKINTAIVIFLAFMFRLLFVNVGIISASTALQNNNFVKSHLSNTMKKNKQFNAQNNSKEAEYSVAELYEEDSDNEFKSNSFFSVQMAYSLFAGKIEKTSSKTIPVFGYFSQNSLHRYLTFQVFRI